MAAQTSTQASAQALHTSLSQLQIAQDSKATPKIKVKKSTAAPVDSWEDEADDNSPSSEDEESDHTPIASPGPPPPTPSSPSQTSLPLTDASPYQTFPPFGLRASDGEGSPTRGSRKGAEGEERRPEKSTAVASRLIAAGIGQKAPKRTKEEREYDSAMKAKERRKRDVEREEEERRVQEREKARRDIWEA